MKQIRIIPKDSLCEACKVGMMITSTMYADRKQIGLHSRKIPAKCDNCGKRGHVVKSYIGVEVDEMPVDSNPLQPDLLADLQAL